jgi:hypothetical protein
MVSYRGTWDISGKNELKVGNFKIHPKDILWSFENI